MKEQRKKEGGGGGGRGEKKKRKMKLIPQQECNEQHENEIKAWNEIAGTEYARSQVRRISPFLFHVNTILDNKCSKEFSHFCNVISTFTAISTSTTHYQLLY